MSMKHEISSLSKERLELLKRLHLERSMEQRRILPCARTSTGDSVYAPATWAQQRLWIIDRLEGGRVGYQVPMAFRLRGGLDQKALEAALRELMQRHETLRTVFVDSDGTLQQSIVATPDNEFAVFDLSGEVPEMREARVLDLRNADVHRKFDLSRGPLIRFHLLKLKSDEHVFLITMHHIIADGWSKSVLLRELTSNYVGHRRGGAGGAEPLSIQYADFASWQQQQWLRSDVRAKQLAYWSERLSGGGVRLDLPSDRARTSVQTYRGKKVRLVLDAELCAALRSFAQRRGLTQFMVLYAALAVLLARLSSEEDIAVGTFVANRQRPELAGLIGLFVNTLVLRTEVRGEMEIEEFVQQVKKVVLGAYDHQSAPFEKVIEQIQLQRDLSRNPLFQVMLVFHNEPKSELQFPGLTVTEEEEIDEPSILDLWFSLEERGEVISGSVNYAADVYDGETVDRWLDSFKLILKEMVAARPRQRIGDLEMMSQREREKVTAQSCVIANATTYILDARRQLVPIGVVGDVYLSGDCVARGYFNRLELKADRFFEDHLTLGVKALMYRTGYRARWRSDGAMEFRGRGDRRVKSRGFQVELGEIEAQLMRHPQIAEAVVLAISNGREGNRLAAYCVYHNQHGPRAYELHAHMRAVLPRYMLPSGYVIMESLPAMPDGTIQSGLLPSPEDAFLALRSSERPQGGVEESLADIWQELLGINEVMRHDDFFELGGHSLLLPRVVAFVYQRLAVMLPLRALYEAATLEELGKRIRMATGSDEVVESSDAERGGGLLWPIADDGAWPSPEPKAFSNPANGREECAK